MKSHRREDEVKDSLPSAAGKPHDVIFGAMFHPRGIVWNGRKPAASHPNVERNHAIYRTSARLRRKRSERGITSPSRLVRELHVRLVLRRLARPERDPVPVARRRLGTPRRQGRRRDRLNPLDLWHQRLAASRRCHSSTTISTPPPPSRLPPTCEPATLAT